MKTTATRMTGPEKATEKTRDDDSSSSYIYTDVVKGKDKKDVDVNSIDDVVDKYYEGKNYMSSAIKKKKGKKKTKRGEGEVKKIRDG